MGKIFKDNANLVVLEVEDKKFLDKDTYVVVFKEMKNFEGESHHIESEYHLDEYKFIHQDVYEHEVINTLLPLSLKTKIEEYILRECGILKGKLIKKKVSFDIVLDCEDATIGDLAKFLKNIDISGIKFPSDSNIKCISAKLGNIIS